MSCSGSPYKTPSPPHGPACHPLPPDVLLSALSDNLRPASHPVGALTPDSSSLGPPKCIEWYAGYAKSRTCAYDRLELNAGCTADCGRDRSFRVAAGGGGGGGCASCCDCDCGIGFDAWDDRRRSPPVRSDRSGRFCDLCDMVLEGTTASSWSCCVARPNEAGEGELPVVCCWYGADAADMTSAILSSPSQRTVAVSCRPLWPRRCYFYRSPLPKRFACLLAATMLASQPEQQQPPAHVSNLTLQIIRRYLGFNVLHSSDSLALLLSLSLSLSPSSTTRYCFFPR